MLRSKDAHGLITHKLLTWDGEQSNEMIATENTWNGCQYECYMCHKTFAQLRPLNQHLNSPAHKQKIYHCPKRDCARDFVSLAALFNHLESESCGFIRFEAVQANVGNFLTGKQKMLGFH